MVSPVVRDSLKTVLGVLGLYDTAAPSSYAEGAGQPTVLPVPVLPAPARAASALSTEALEEAAAEALSQAPTPTGHEPGLMEDLLGMSLTVANVEEVLDEMVRPALNADGGDIALVKIEDSDIYVRLVGACSSCPSAIMTMKMGVERLLQEEFPDMGELINVDEMMGV